MWQSRFRRDREYRSIVELVNRWSADQLCGSRDFNRDARYADAQFRQSYQPQGSRDTAELRVYCIVWPRRDSLGTIYRRLMKCLVLRLRAMARSVFTVTISLINWLTHNQSVRPARSIYRTYQERCVYTCLSSKDFYLTEADFFS